VTATSSGSAPRSPIASTYRLQLSSAVPFGAAARLAPYLARLGVTTCYTSPILAARPGSPHGYDTCDHARLDDDRGGEAGFAELVAALRAHDLGLVVDFVPNHMSTDPVANPWWHGVLENGPSSDFARYFDIDWDPIKPALKGKVLLPVLGDQYGTTLAQGHLQVQFRDGVFALQHVDRELPLNPRELRRLLRHGLDAIAGDPGAADPALTELQSIIFQLDHMPGYTDTKTEQRASRNRETDVSRQRLERLIAESPRIRQHLEANIVRFNGVPGHVESFDLLHDMLEHQAYRLSFWRTAMHEINYRRFFDINELAGLRVEEPDVFTAVHVRIAALVAEGTIDGLRLDHVDGLFDPAGYLDRLAELVGNAAPYIVVEKILSPGEPLPDRWQAHGTTGYDFLNDVNGIFVDGRNAHEFRKLYARFSGQRQALDAVDYESKKAVIASSMASELNVLAHELDRISEQHRQFRDFTLDSLQDALREIVACFPTYRTYVSADGWTRFDERCIDLAVGRALARNPATEPSIFAFIRQMLLPVRTADLSEHQYRQRLRFAMKFQQYTGPLQAKGIEDTAFYRYAPLVSINEVGGDAGRFGRSVEDFHRANEARQRTRPFAMTTTATHDTKRGEDARARINVLSEMPGDWRPIVSRWARAAASARSLVDGDPAPDRRDEYLLYQALVGAWPAGLAGPPDAALVDRIRAYMLKAVREAKVHSSWVHPSPAYDEAVGAFVDRVLAGPASRAFLRLFLPFAARIARLGAVNALSQLVLKIASPGVPDFYQGSELWDLALVDPDNRRPVDFEARAAMLAGLEPWLDEACPLDARVAGVTSLLAAWEDGRIKLYVTAAGLRLRRRDPNLFLAAPYLPLTPDGELAAHVVAFARTTPTRALVTIAPRLVTTLFGSPAPLPPGPEAWRDLAVPLPDELAHFRYRHVLTGEPIPVRRTNGRAALAVADALRVVPAALVLGTPVEAA
jgi:(1->4)-alpha-D-glucan 1-alpha-D-glucosylmutase